MPEIQDLFKSGNLERLVLKDNIQLSRTDETYLEGLQHIVGDNGLTQLEVQPDLYLKWIDTDTSVIPLGATMPNYLLTVIPNKAILPSNGIIQAAFKITKQSILPGNVFVDVYLNDTLHATKNISLPKNMPEKYPILITALFDTPVPENTPIHIKLRKGAGTNVTVNGNEFPSTLRVIKTKEIVTGDNIGENMIGFRAASIVDQTISKYNNTLQFDVFDYNNKVQYDQAEDFFRFLDAGNVDFDLQLNVDFDGGQEKFWIWLEKYDAAGDIWLAQTAEQYYIEFNHNTEGLRNVKFKAKVLPNEKYRIRHASAHPVIHCKLKMQQFTTYDGTPLTVGSAKVTITQTL